MLDKSLKHYGVIMTKSDKIYPKYALRDGYHFKYYEKGDEKDWAALEYAVDEFESVEDGILYFKDNFLIDLEGVKKRCLFVCDAYGNKIATASAWYGNLDGKKRARIHWVSVHPNHHGLGLCKAMMTELLDQYKRLGYEDLIYLTSQTWSYKAINIYKGFGFLPYDDGASGQYKGSAGDYEIDFETAWQLIDDKLNAYKEK